MNEIAIGLIVAAVVGIVALLRRQILRQWRRRRAVEFSLEPIIGEEWSVAFAGDMPDASKIEGSEHSGRKV